VGICQIVALLVALQRLAELGLARRNAGRLVAAGGVEHGAGHYRLFVALHGAWLAALFFLVPPQAPVQWWLLGLYGLLQIGRFWVIASLGPRWTTRVVVLPEAPLVMRGPYRLLRHPNYAIVALEIPVLPLAFGAWQIAIAFALANLALTAHRIRVEERALAPLRVKRS
jgi:methyltransferase